MLPVVIVRIGIPVGPAGALFFRRDDGGAVGGRLYIIRITEEPVYISAVWVIRSLIHEAQIAHIIHL